MLLTSRGLARAAPSAHDASPPCFSGRPVAPLRLSSAAGTKLAPCANGGAGRARQPLLVTHCSSRGPLEGGSSEELPRDQAHNGQPGETPSTSGKGSSSNNNPFTWPEFSTFKPPQGWVRVNLPPGAGSRGSLQPGATASLDESWGDFSNDSFVPPPSNLPTNESDGAFASGSSSSSDSNSNQSLNESLLSRWNAQQQQQQQQQGGLRKDLWTITDQPGIDLFLAGPRVWGRMPQVYVILFGVGERDTEGIYSLRAFGGDGVPHETIIAFEREDDALRYAGLLEASMDHTPNVCSIPPRELLNFCLDQGYSCRLEPNGTLLIPPDFNVGVTDWERSIRLREGKFSVLEDEPDHHRSSTSSAASASASGGSSTATAPAPPPPTLTNLNLGGGGGGGVHHGHGHGHGIAGPGISSGSSSSTSGGNGMSSSGSGAGSGPAGVGSGSSALARFSQAYTGDDLDAIKARLEALLPKD